MKERVPVTARALVQRINRALAKKGQVLKASRGAASGRLGGYYIVHLRRNAVVTADLDLQQVGRDLGVLLPYEELAD